MSLYMKRHLLQVLAAMIDRKAHELFPSVLTH